MLNQEKLEVWLRVILAIVAAALISTSASAQGGLRLPPPETWDCWSWTGDERDSYCAPKGPYAERCEFRVADSWERPQLLFAFCDGESVMLPLPCNGAIFFEPGRLECRPAPKGLKAARPRPPNSEPIAGCTRLRLVKNGLEAQCRRRNGSMQPAFLPLPCAGRVVNDDGRLLCVKRPR